MCCVGVVALSRTLLLPESPSESSLSGVSNLRRRPSLRPFPSAFAVPRLFILSGLFSSFHISRCHQFLLPLGSFNLYLGPGRCASCPTLTPTSPPACCRVCFASNVRLDVIAHFLAQIASSLKLSAFPLAFFRVVGSVGSRNVSCWTECANTRLSSSGMISNSTRSMVNRQRRAPNGKRD